MNKKLPYFDTLTPLVESELVNLKEPAILTKYLNKDCNSTTELPKVMNIVKRTYESRIRPASTAKYGGVFAMNPEALAYAMQVSRGQIALEIGGASGENAILLACSEASHVYLNDIDPKEIAKFEALKGGLPLAIKRKLTALEGDCFDLLDQQPTLLNRVGFILCQNFIHFLNDREQLKFFNLTKRILRPYGRAMFVANSIHPHSTHKLLSTHPTATTFRIMQCLITDYEKGTMPIANIFEDIFLGDDDASYTEYTSLYLYEKGKDTEYKWQANKEEYQRIPERTTRKQISDAIQKYQPLLKTINQGNVRVLINNYKIYSLETLASTMKKHGFEVESAFGLTMEGHIVKNPELLKTAKKVGVIVKNSL